MVGTQGHTSPEQFGKVMSLVKPRLAVGYHFYNDFDTEPEVRKRVRKTYDGPLDLATGLHGLERHQGRHPGADVRHRRGDLAESGAQEEDRTGHGQRHRVLGVHDLRRAGISRGHRPIFDEINEKYGTDVEPIFKK